MTSAQVSGYTRKDGTKVSGYTQGRPAASGRHRSTKAKAQLAGAGALAFVGAVQMLTATMSLVTAVLTVTTSSLLAWGGYKGVKKKRRKGHRRPARTGVSRFGTVRLTTEAEVAAYIKLQEWKREQRRQRYAAVASVVKRRTS